MNLANLPNLVFGPAQWLELFIHFGSLSLLAVGGAITAAPDMHRFLVDEQSWLTDAEFSSSIALAQAAPGPNVLFVALMGWYVGLNTAGGVAAGVSAWPAGLLGVVMCMGGIMIPSSLLVYQATRWGHKNREMRAVRAFKAGLAPMVIALLLSTGWLLTAQHNVPARDWHLWLVVAVSAMVMWRTKIHLLWFLAGGALLGGLGWI